MIHGHYEQTYDLTEAEKALLPGMIKAFSKRIGKNNAITSVEITRHYKSVGIKMDGSRIRKLVNHIRINNLVPCLISDSKGYWVEPDPKETKKYIDALKDRAQAIYYVARKLEESISQ